MSKKFVDPNDKNAEAVRVAIRCRPMSDKEMSNGHSKAVECTKEGAIFVKRPYTDEPPK